MSPPYSQAAYKNLIPQLISFDVERTEDLKNIKEPGDREWGKTASISRQEFGKLDGAQHDDNRSIR
jgi:hypothetical protein